MGILTGTRGELAFRVGLQTDVISEQLYCDFAAEILSDFRLWCFKIHQTSPSPSEGVNITLSFAINVTLHLPVSSQDEREVNKEDNEES